MRRVRRDSVRKITDSTSLRVALSRRSRSVVITRSRGSLMHGTLYSTARFNQNIGEQRMDVEIQMAVDMVEVADQLEMPLDLRAQLVGHRGAHRAVEEISHAGGDGTVDELARRAHRRAEPRGVEHAASAADDRMQADVELGIFAREFGGGARGRLRNHQARTAQNPVAMRAHDAGVDLGRQAEVVGVNDEALQTAGTAS